VPIQFGGGLRTLDDIRLAIELGADRVVLGTVAIENPGLVSEAILSWGADRIVVGIDARDGKVATHGWQQISDVDIVDLGHQMQAIGVKRVIYTDIGRDGMMRGVNAESAARLGDVTGLHVIASGGVADIKDIERLKDVEHFDVEGVIIGQAIYTHALDLAEAIKIGHRQLVARSAGIIPFRMGEVGPEFLILYNWYYELWEFPRTQVVAHEDLVEAAVRGVFEMAGQRIRDFHEECCSTLEYVAQVRDYEIQHTVVYYLAEVERSEVVLGDEDHCEAQWGDYDSTWELLTETAPMLLPALDRAVSCLDSLQTE
jgi:phosphoribosylformimino-5-aminoimidazole carboxamide ribonucleotide (ProFAR) isomerase/ADP-ribose pyrophosphatase YjhB (NUDIX family)